MMEYVSNATNLIYLAMMGYFAIQEFVWIVQLMQIAPLLKVKKSVILRQVYVLNAWLIQIADIMTVMQQFATTLYVFNVLGIKNVDSWPA
jgi:hypothetical protein